MGMIKKTNYKGVDVEYFCITNLIYNKFENSTFVIVSAFKNKETRTNGLNQALYDVRKLFSESGEMTLADCYKQLKQMDYFEEALDD